MTNFYFFSTINDFLIIFLLSSDCNYFRVNVYNFTFFFLYLLFYVKTCVFNVLEIESFNFFNKLFSNLKCIKSVPKSSLTRPLFYKIAWKIEYVPRFVYDILSIVNLQINANKSGPYIKIKDNQLTTKIWIPCIYTKLLSCHMGPQK